MIIKELQNKVRDRLTATGPRAVARRVEWRVKAYYTDADAGGIKFERTIGGGVQSKLWLDRAEIIGDRKLTLSYNPKSYAPTNRLVVDRPSSLWRRPTVSLQRFDPNTPVEETDWKKMPRRKRRAVMEEFHLLPDPRDLTSVKNILKS